MSSTRKRILGIAGVAACVAAFVLFAGRAIAARVKAPTPLKEAKMIIEHNATDHDTGFQLFVDGEGWDRLDVIGPQGPVLRIEGKGALGELGLTELFLETVEPENADVPIAELLEDIPAGRYTLRGHEMADGEAGGETVGTATLTHDIPAGPQLLAPAADAAVAPDDVVFRWGAVTQSLRGTPVRIVGYQLIVEKDAPPPAHMIGKWGLSMYLPAGTTSMAMPRGFFEPRTAYKWEVLAIEESGNQTLSSGAFRTL